MANKRRYQFVIYHFDDDKVLNGTERLITKPLFLKDFARVLNERLNKITGGYCYEILTPMSQKERSNLKKLTM